MLPLPGWRLHGRIITNRSSFRFSLAACLAAPIERAAGQGAASAADDRAHRAMMTAGNAVAEIPARQRADEESGGAVVAASIAIAPVGMVAFIILVVVIGMTAILPFLVPMVAIIAFVVALRPALVIIVMAGKGRSRMRRREGGQREYQQRA